MQGVVTKSTGSWYEVFLKEEKTTISARLLGIFRLDQSRDTNPVAVGDFVTIDREMDDFVISKIADRKNYIIRQSPKHRVLRHVIASNLDQAIVVASISKPRTSNGFIDRFLVSSEAYHIPSIIVFNKVDIYSEKDKQTLENWSATYQKAGYKILMTSTYTGEGIEELKEILRNKRSLFSGHSGVGKSSLLNSVEPSLDLRTNEISAKHEKGMHTTTFSELFRIENLNAEIIDTPGIKEFGVLQMEDYELKDFFIEFLPYLNQCKFHNCLHIREPDCMVRDAIEKGEIAGWRHQNYLNILDDIRDQSAAWELKKRGI
jgi:ribosome biogenesis GTPase